MTQLPVAIVLPIITTILHLSKVVVILNSLILITIKQATVNYNTNSLSKHSNKKKKKKIAKTKKKHKPKKVVLHNDSNLYSFHLPYNYSTQDTLSNLNHINRQYDEITQTSTLKNFPNISFTFITFNFNLTNDSLINID